MILVREVFQAKFGRVNELVALFEEARDSWLHDLDARLLVDLSGRFFTAVVEVELESLSDWEQRMPELFAGAQVSGWFERLAPLVQSGTREFYRVRA